jgi:hypothetical protein
MSSAFIFRAQRYAARLYAALLALAAIRVVWVALPLYFNVWPMLFSLVLIAWSCALLKVAPMAMRFTGAICLLAALFLPLGIFNPFAAMDSAVSGSNPSSIMQSLIWFVPIEVILLASAYILDFSQATATQSKGKS